MLRTLFEIRSLTYKHHNFRNNVKKNCSLQSNQGYNNTARYLCQWRAFKSGVVACSVFFLKQNLSADGRRLNGPWKGREGFLIIKTSFFILLLLLNDLLR